MNSGHQKDTDDALILGFIFKRQKNGHVCVQFQFGHQLLPLSSTSHPIQHLLVQPPSTPPGALQPLRGLTKILRALTFAGHLAHPHQSVEVALCSICDTWKHGSIGHQIKGAELK